MKNSRQETNLANSNSNRQHSGQATVVLIPAWSATEVVFQGLQQRQRPMRLDMITIKFCDQISENQKVDNTFSSVKRLWMLRQ